MEIKQAKRLNHFETGIFSSLNEEKEKLIKEGKKLYNLFIGTPDFTPPKHVIDALVESAKKPESWKYSLTESEDLLNAVCSYYKRRFNTDITPDIITAVNGVSVENLEDFYEELSKVTKFINFDIYSNGGTITTGTYKF